MYNWCSKTSFCYKPKAKAGGSSENVRKLVLSKEEIKKILPNQEKEDFINFLRSVEDALQELG